MYRLIFGKCVVHSTARQYRRCELIGFSLSSGCGQTGRQGFLYYLIKKGLWMMMFDVSGPDFCMGIDVSLLQTLDCTYVWDLQVDGAAGSAVGLQSD